MKNLKSILSMINEGGSSGHMAHPQDYSDYTLSDLVELIDKLFSNSLEFQEKVDGMNLQATKNNQNEVVFIRNKGDLNSERGGMSISDMITKWSDKPHVLETFKKSATIITQVFQNIPSSFFNPDPTTKLYANCECVLQGKTNIMPYIKDQVDFHNLWIYKWDGTQWQKDEVTKKGLERIEKECVGTSAKITPKVIIEVSERSNTLKSKYTKEITRIFTSNGLSDYSTIDDYKRLKYKEYIAKNQKWILKNKDGIDILYKRWFDGLKTVNLKVLKTMYGEDVESLVNLDNKKYKEMVEEVMGPLDSFFLHLGNDILSLCKDIINGDRKEEVVRELRKDLNDVVGEIRKNGTLELNDKLTKQLHRLDELGDDNINALEGIVFSYKGKIMKLTGGFAPLNQILGAIRYSL